jgi:xylan 1,4-beta-xylosidase
MARSSSLYGPYETDPENPILTSWEYPDAELKKAGHADLVETDDGWYMVHLCSRPIAIGVRGGNEGWSILGRETSIQKMTWTDEGWLRLEAGGRIPKTSVPAPVYQA